MNDESFAGNVSLIATFLKEDYSRFEQELTELTAGQAEPILLATIDDD
jgi:hypothetical protein